MGAHKEDKRRHRADITNRHVLFLDRFYSRLNGKLQREVSYLLLLSVFGAQCSLGRMVCYFGVEFNFHVVYDIWYEKRH